MENKNQPEFEILSVENGKYTTLLTKKYRNRKPYKEIENDKIYAFISGTIRSIVIKEADQVSIGDDILVLEAMKMNNIIKSAVNGKIKKIHATEDVRVSKDQLLVEIELDPLS